jgi:hypothetical protein
MVIKERMNEKGNWFDNRKIVIEMDKNGVAWRFKNKNIKANQKTQN